MYHLGSCKQAPCSVSRHVWSLAAFSSYSLRDLIGLWCKQEMTEVQFLVPIVHLVFVEEICTCWYPVRYYIHYTSGTTLPLFSHNLCYILIWLSILFQLFFFLSHLQLHWVNCSVAFIHITWASAAMVQISFFFFFTLFDRDTWTSIPRFPFLSENFKDFLFIPS